MKKFKIIKGKLCNNKGEPITLEFGNREQIEFIREHERMVEQFNGEGVELDVSWEAHYTAETHIDCPCGQTIWIETDADDEDDVECLDRAEKGCRSCGTEYVLIVKDNYEVVAIIKNEDNF